MSRKENILFISLFFLVSGCIIQKKEVSDPISFSKKKKITTELVQFFDAENARLLGNSSNSLLLYANFVKKYPTNSTALFNLSRLYFSKKNTVESEKYIKAACAISPSNNFFQEFYCQILVYNNKLKEATKVYDKLIEENSYKPEYIFRKAQLNLKQKDYNEAVNNLNLYEKKTGFNEDISIQKKNIYLYQHKNELAIEEIKKLQNNDPTSVENYIMLADIYESIKNTQEASRIYSYIENNFTTDPVALISLADHYLNSKNESEYHKFMMKIMENKNISVDNKIALIMPSLKKMNADSVTENNKIINYAQSIVTQSPENKEAILLYANVLAISNQSENAIKQYKKYTAIDSSQLDVWTTIISQYFDSKEYDSALLFSDRTIKQFPANATPYFYKGMILIQKNEVDKAIDVLELALKKESNNNVLSTQIYSSLGDAYNTQKKYQESDSSFEKALKINPNEATTLNNYAYYLSLRKERLEDAERMSKLSLTLQPNSKSFLDTYGWILYQQGNYEEAKKYIEKAIASTTEKDGALYEHLGDVFYKLNNQQKAIQSWKTANEMGEKNLILLKKINTGKINE